jgi:hypothetical protein
MDFERYDTPEYRPEMPKAKDHPVVMGGVYFVSGVVLAHVTPGLLRAIRNFFGRGGRGI